MKKSDFFTMIYQFIGAGLVFFFSALDNYQNFSTGKVIYLPGSLGIDQGFTIGYLGVVIMLIIGYLGLFIQRELYIRRQIKKAIEPYKGREV